jgi:putative transposase
MGSAIYQHPKTSEPHPRHKTYIQMRRGFHYLVAIMDWASRKVLAWRLSNTMDTEFCVAALEEAIARHGRPDILNTDSQWINASSRAA